MPEAGNGPPPILTVRDVRKAFGGLPAVAGATFSVAPGSITALIGPNGAGKTTLFNVVSGFYAPDGGDIVYAGRSIARSTVHTIARLGLVRTFQITRVWAAMSVLENLLVAARDQPGERLGRLVLGRLVPGRRAVSRRESAIRARALELLGRFDLADKAGDYAGTLSAGQRKLLDLARVLMVEPRLVLLDEPMAGVNPTLGRRLLEYIAEQRRTHGLTCLFVEHNMDVVMDHSDRVIVMAEGRVIAEGPPDTVRNDARVIDAYLGAAR